ncbi:amino acid degradation protein [Sporosarcina sp. P16b]|uniref:M20/M25/M40 family metallo-hydrolase n=1 Tax=Sporosarcina sp. P16b TaxID=2048261 RepID=UPI000C1648D0|nr:M20/M25/M40 family metallo-hydrolase [Sporosarcina sp. P16b]PIC70889.1 amino acid degradation protein [Sporosarcina sp. P16b]
MNRYRFDTPEKLRALLCELVSWDSRTLTEGERFFSWKLQNKLSELEYFTENADNITLHDAGLGRQVVHALYEHPDATDTIVLISHFDTVQTDEYGALEPLAFHPEELTKKLLENKDMLPEAARLDLESGKYLFGRGTMDMKMGLALHIQLIERASMENWPINLLLCTVPDEEVNSAGMRAAVKELVRLQEQEGHRFKLFLNGEPSFSQGPADTKEYIYSGTIGKIMPAALFYGKETHVGEPLKGITADYIASFLTQKMEWNPLFLEIEQNESTPLPVTLHQKDLKIQYSTQTPQRAAALYNVFLFKRTAAEIMNIFEQVANEAMALCTEHYKAVCARESAVPLGDIRVLRFEELLTYAEDQLGKNEVNRLKQEVLLQEEWDDREQCIRIVDTLMMACQELGPATVLFYAPPYYPAVNSSDDPLVKESIAFVQERAQVFDLTIEQVHYFNGICDLSYVHYKDEEDHWKAFAENTPVYGATYSIPFEDMRKLTAPVLNVGPFGKDAHQKTERLHIDSAFREMPVLLEQLVKKLAGMNQTKSR